MINSCCECFEKQRNIRSKDLEEPNIFQIWNFRKGAAIFDQGLFFMEDLTKEHIGYKETDGELSSQQRQWIQIEKAVNSDSSSFVLNDSLKKEMGAWNYPLHFVDFETSAAALPFTKDRRPFEQIVFQFSHHIYHKDGRIEHATQYLNNKIGVFPNFEFIRELKQALSMDIGTIFKYSPFENTILNAIYEQLVKSNEHDKVELIGFIKDISHSKKESEIKWTGSRDMVDLCEVIKKYYYNPLTHGSNSIKDVLPAVLNSSKFLQLKYSKKIVESNITSLNFPEDHTWIVSKNDKITNPYKKLPPLFDNWTIEQIESTLSDIEGITDGGAALTAYGKLQYTDMQEIEIEELTKALLMYCELDTLAMVMIFEHLNEDLR